MGGDRKEKSVFNDSNIGLRHDGFLLDAYLRKASESDTYLIALCGN